MDVWARMRAKRMRECQNTAQKSSKRYSKLFCESACQGLRRLAIVRLPFDDAAKNAARQTGEARKEVSGKCRDGGVVKHVDYGMQVFVKRVEQVVKRNAASKKFCKK